MKWRPTQRVIWTLLLLCLVVLMSLRVPWALTFRSQCNDLEERWIGTRALLLEGRNPYSDEITREAQIPCYGTDPSKVDFHDPKPFLYPVYVALLLAPTIQWHWRTVQWVAVGVYVLLSALSALWWVRIFDLPDRWAVVVATLLLLSPAMLEGIHVQQMGLLAPPLLAASVLLIRRSKFVPAGIIMGVATVKPPAVLYAIGFLLVWSVADWRSRGRLAVSFLTTLFCLCIAGELLLPGWISQFVRATRAYRTYAGVTLPEITFGRPIGIILMALALVWLMLKVWRARHSEPASEEFLDTLAACMGMVVLTTFSLYNFVQFVPRILGVVKGRRR